MSVPFNNTVKVLQTFNSLPTGAYVLVSGAKVYGYSAAQIFAQLNIILPLNGLTLANVVDVLYYGSKKGIFTVVGCLPGTKPTYWVNPAMVQSNYQNISYLRASLNYNGFIPGPVNGFTAGTFVDGSPGTAAPACATNGNFAGASNFTPGGVAGLGGSGVSVSCP